jgi:hypothetical protein
MNSAYIKYLIVFLYLLAFYTSTGQESIKSWERLTAKPYLYERMDLEIRLVVPFVNPYDATEIALDLILVTPSSKELRLPCFYVSGDQDQSVWNARFLPQETGDYSYRFQLSKNKEIVESTATGHFSVLASAKKGILHSDNNWIFRYDSGKPFRGIGENVGWEARDWENQNYRYDYFLPNLARNGVNFFRTWSCIWNLPVEWKIAKNTRFFSSTSEYFNPGGIRRMDELIEMVDSLDMHIMLVLVPHGALITSGEWPNNPYNVKNGGPASTPTEFFTLPESKQKFKNTLRYFVARWGYSPGIGAWEFCNEIDNAAYNGGASLAIPEAAITQWHTEMSEYLSGLDIYNHPITTSISHREIKGLYDVPNIDFNQQHIYRNTGSIPSKIKHYQAVHAKPYVIGEFGYEWDWTKDFDVIGEEMDFDFKRGLWYGMFTSTPVLPLSWWWEFFDERNMYPYYRSVASVSEKMLLAGKGDFQPATATAVGFECYAVQCGASYFIYLLNNSQEAMESIVRLSIEGTNPYSVISLAPSLNKYLALPEKAPLSGMIDFGMIRLGAREEVVFVVSPDRESIGFTSPYPGSPGNLPGILEAENFDRGMNGSAYLDFDAENLGGVYRPEEGVDIYSNEGGFFVHNIIKKEWLKYSVRISESGIYSARAKVASGEAGKRFRLFLNGTAITNDLIVPQTGGEEDWQIMTIPLTIDKLVKSDQVLTVEFLDSGFSIDYLEFVLENKTPVVSWVVPDKSAIYEYPASINLKVEVSDADGEVTKVTCFDGTKLIGEMASPPYTWTWTPAVGLHSVYAIVSDDNGLTASSDTLLVIVAVPNRIPGTIEAENYDVGDNGKAYMDLTKGNKFGSYRNGDVDLEECADEGGGFSLGDFQTGEWLNYTVHVEKSGVYNIDFRVATQINGGALSLAVNGKAVAGRIYVPNTGGWQVWNTISVPGIQLSEGKQVITLGSVAQYVNVNSLVFSNTTSVVELPRSKISCYPNPAQSTLYFSVPPNCTYNVIVYDGMGRCVKIESLERTYIDVRCLVPGFYSIVVVSDKNEVLSRMKLVKV